jgi:hypothetical protein
MSFGHMGSGFYPSNSDTIVGRDFGIGFSRILLAIFVLSVLDPGFLWLIINSVPPCTKFVVFTFKNSTETQ